MKDMLEHQARTDELSIVFHFTDGEKYTQTLPIDHADAAQSVMDWFNDPKGSPAWTWLHPQNSIVRMIPRTQVTCIEIFGYIQPDGNDSKWYQRLSDKIRTKMMLRKL